jgi:NhaA family Na+:H+ antiporter
MLVPAGIYLLFNYGGKPEQVSLWQLICFCIGNLILIRESSTIVFENILNGISGNRRFRAIMVIAIFYTKTFYGLIFYALGTMLILFVLNRMKVKI